MGAPLLKEASDLLFTGITSIYIFGRVKTLLNLGYAMKL